MEHGWLKRELRLVEVVLGLTAISRLPKPTLVMTSTLYTYTNCQHVATSKLLLKVLANMYIYIYIHVYIYIRYV